MRDDALAGTSAGAVTSLLAILVGSDAAGTLSSPVALACKLLLPLWQTDGDVATLGEEFTNLLRATVMAGVLRPAPLTLQYPSTVTTVLQHLVAAEGDTNAAIAPAPSRGDAHAPRWLRSLQHAQSLLRAHTLHWLRVAAQWLQRARTGFSRGIDTLTVAAHDPARAAWLRCCASMAAYTLLHALDLLRLALDVHTARAFMMPGRTVDAGLAFASLTFVTHKPIMPTDVSWARQYRMLGILLALKSAMRAAAFVSGAYTVVQRAVRTRTIARSSEQPAPARVDASTGASAADGGNAHTCPLCLQPRTHAACAPCGHMFCWGCIVQALMHRPACPVCRAPALPQQAQLLVKYA